MPQNDIVGWKYRLEEEQENMNDELETINWKVHLCLRNIL